MLVDEATRTPPPGIAAAPQAGQGKRRRARSGPVAQALAFVAAAGLILLYSLRGGGSYDLVTFEQQGLVVWWLLAVGLALGVLPRVRPARPVLLLGAALAAYSAWTALSLLWTQSAELTTEELARSLDFLGLVALAGALLDRDSWRAAAAGLGLGALLVCVIAVGSRLDPAVFGVDHVDAVLHSYRLSYPFGYWNSLAGFGAMCTALGLAWSAHDSSRVRRAVALGLVPVAATMTYLTYSRAGVFGTALAVVAAVALSRNRITATLHAATAAAGTALAILAVRGAPQIVHATGTHGGGTVLGALVFAFALCAAAAFATGWARIDRWRLPKGLRQPLAAAATIAVLVPGVALGPRIATRAWHSFTRVAATKTTADPAARLSSLSGSRYLYWKTAIKAFDARPATGTGAGTFEFWSNGHGGGSEFVRDAHNIWLENMAELGLPGLLLIVAVGIAAIGVPVAVRRRARRSVTAGGAAAFLAVVLVYLLHASVDWMWESTAATVFALAGVAVVGGRLARSRPRLTLPLRAALVAVAAGAALVQLPGMISTTAVRNSQVADRAGDLARALQLARDAVTAEPWSASAHEQEALVLEQGGQLRQARKQESIAISDEPTNYAHWLIRSRIETELGQLSLAIRSYDRAYQLRPYSAIFAYAPYFKTR
jgi:hypothetical protein